MRAIHNTYTQILLLFLGVAAFQLYLIYPDFIINIYPYSDYAIDILLADKRMSETGYLLNGQHSIYGYYHLGPFFLYSSYVFEFLFGGLPISRYQAWQLGCLVLNSVFLVYSAVAIAKFLNTKYTLIFSILCIVVAIGYGIYPNVTNIPSDNSINYITNTWMPFRIIMPYLAFVVSLLHLCKGDLRFTVPASLCTGILVHGYVTMPVFTVPFLIIATVIALYTHKRMGIMGIIRTYYRYFIASAAIACIFIFPIAVDYVIHTPSNLHKIYWSKSYDNALSFASLSHVLDKIRFLFTFRQHTLWLAFIAVIIPILMTSKTTPEQRKNSIMAVVLCIFMMAVIILAISTVPIGRIETYIMVFMRVFPTLLISCVLCIAIQGILNTPPLYSRLFHTKNIIRLSGFTILLMVVIKDIQRPNTYDIERINNRITTIGNILLSQAHNNTVYLEFKKDWHTLWLLAPALHFYLQEHNVNVHAMNDYFPWDNNSIKRTDLYTITPDMVTSIIPADACNGNCDTIVDKFGIQFKTSPWLSNIINIRKGFHNAIPIHKDVFDIRYNASNHTLYYIKTNDTAQRCKPDSERTFLLHVFAKNPSDLPHDRQQAGFDILDHKIRYLNTPTTDNRCIIYATLPTYPIKHIITGQFNARIFRKSGAWHSLWEVHNLKLPHKK